MKSFFGAFLFFLLLGAVSAVTPKRFFIPEHERFRSDFLLKNIASQYPGICEMDRFCNAMQVFQIVCPQLPPFFEVLPAGSDCFGIPTQYTHEQISPYAHQSSVAFIVGTGGDEPVSLSHQCAPTTDFVFHPIEGSKPIGSSSKPRRSTERVICTLYSVPTGENVFIRFMQCDTLLIDKGRDIIYNLTTLAAFLQCPSAGACLDPPLWQEDKDYMQRTGLTLSDLSAYPILLDDGHDGRLWRTVETPYGFKTRILGNIYDDLDLNLEDLNVFAKVKMLMNQSPRYKLDTSSGNLLTLRLDDVPSAIIHAYRHEYSAHQVSLYANNRGTRYQVVFHHLTGEDVYALCNGGFEKLGINLRVSIPVDFLFAGLVSIITVMLLASVCIIYTLKEDKKRRNASVLAIQKALSAQDAPRPEQEQEEEDLKNKKEK